MKNGPFGSPKRAAAASPDADLLAIQALTFIGSNPDHAERFFALCGAAPDDLRRAAADPGFLLGVMDYLVGDEPLLLLFADHAGVPPEAVVEAHGRMARR